MLSRRATMAHDLTRDELNAALVAWCHLRAHAEPLVETLPSSLAWLRTRWEAGDDHLPLLLVHDLGHLLLRGRDFRFASACDLDRWPDDERALRLAYEDRVLGRWALDPSVTDAHVIVAGLPSGRRDMAIAHAIGLALAKPLRAAGAIVRGNPAHLRVRIEAIAKEPAEALEDFIGPPEPAWRRWALEQLAALLPCVPVGRLFRPEDLWELAHLSELPDESARLALREIHGLVTRIGAAAPSTLAGIRRAVREVPIDLETPDHYPAGGFDAIATRGSLENMVRSEAIYVGEGGHVDLFDLRLTEGELLFYTRDESPQLDARRDIVFVIDRPALQRHKLVGLEAQTIVLGEALALTLHDDLLRVLGPRSSHVHLSWRCADATDRSAASEEGLLLAIPLASELAHRRIAISSVDTWSDVPDGARVVLSPDAPEDGFSHVAWVRVGDEAWQALDRSWSLRGGPAMLRALADALLMALARCRVLRARTRHGTAPLQPVS